jgi:hypothetical protein
MKIKHVKPAGWVDSSEVGKIQPSDVAGLVHEVEWEAGDLPGAGQGGGVFGFADDGGFVQQTGALGSPVTLNALHGKIKTVSVSLNSLANNGATGFVLNNDKIQVGDMLYVQRLANSETLDYQSTFVWASILGPGKAKISLGYFYTGPTAENHNIYFAVIKAPFNG